MATPSSKKAPWKNPRRKPPTTKKLTPALKSISRKAAKKAGRPYPNLVDTMRAAKRAKK